MATDRHIEQHVVVLGEEPRVGRGDLGAVQFEVDLSVHRPPDVIGPPFHRVDVEGCGPIGRGNRAAHRLDIPDLAPVGGAVAVARQVANDFHDVDLAGPGVVFPQHPERRPNPLPRGQINPRLPLAVGLAEFVAGHHPGGGVVAPGEILLPGRDDEVAIEDIRVVGVVGVVLELSIAPAPKALRRTGSDVIAPLGVVDGGPVELIAPGQRPGLGGKPQRSQEEKKGGEEVSHDARCSPEDTAQWRKLTLRRPDRRPRAPSRDPRR